MKTIYKYPITRRDNKIELPITWKFVHFGLDGRGVECMWAEVDNNTNKFVYDFQIVGTGWEFEDTFLSLGTYVDAEGFVWHLVMRGVST